MSLHHNLKYLCSFYPSIAEICRGIGINRQQFNRYLNGDNCPRSYNMRQICDYFGLSKAEFLLPHDQFVSLVNSRADGHTQALHHPFSSHISKLSEQNIEMFEPYMGYYYEYYYSMSSPGNILKGLVCIERKQGGIYHQRTERLTAEGEFGQTSYCKYQGMSFFLNDRIFLVDYESLTQNEIVETILFPSFQHRVSLLEGMKIGVAASGARTPMSTKVVFEYLGKNIDVLKALKKCSLYASDSESISANIRSKL
ncbi:XRE family transcriptional regulator [Photobacterium alginatilyticum]|uniref:XRE family transcriptional regulator n=2 Tax=Photobacterium alginatilyticum TaxID=1775171 RepID=A0ABW9YJ59_9GAMM|nr:XRE family transcriptional regulator [Photobacterium alginatilyticum]